MTNVLEDFKVEDALETAAALLQLISLLDADRQERLILALKAEANRLIQVDLERCLKLAALIHQLADLTGTPTHHALGLLVEANAYAIGQGKYQQSIEPYSQAAQIYAQQNQPVEQAKALIGKLYALSNLSRYDEALADGEWARQVLREHEEWFHLARLKVNLAIVYGRLGRDETALEFFNLARDVYNKLGPEVELQRLRVEINRAHVLRNLGRFQESINASQAVYEAHQRLGRAVDAARARQSLALTYFLLGRYNEALLLLDEVQEVFLKGDRKRNAMLVELFVSDCLLHLRRFAEVLDKTHRVRELFAELGTRFEVGQAILNEAAAYMGMQQYVEAQASLQEARFLFDQEGNRVAIAESDLQAAHVALRRQQPQSALRLASQAAQCFQEYHLPLWQARAYLVAAQAAMSNPDAPALAQAEDLINQALKIGEQYHLPAVTFAGRHLHGQVSVQQGQPDFGLVDFDRAIQDLELLCGRMMVEFRAGFMEDKERLYEDTVLLCLDTNQAERGLAYAERAKSRALLEMLANRLDLSLTPRSDSDRPLVEELIQLRSERDQIYRRWGAGEGLGVRGETGQRMDEDTQTNRKVLALEKQITGLWHKLLIRNADYARDATLWQVQTEPVQPYLAEDCLILEYFAIHGKLVVFLVSKRATCAVRLAAGLEEVQSLLQFFWFNLRNIPYSRPERIAALTRNAQGILQKLYRLLLEPLEEDIQGSARLVIVPHGPLHYLPFQALHDGQSYLIEQHEISFLPGASFLRYTAETPKQTGGMLVIGNSYQGRLPFTVEEAQQVAQIWNAAALVEDQARLQTFRQAAQSSSIMHIAAHGEFRADNPLFSGLALSDGWLTTFDVFNLHLNASLVTLSACQTGRSVVGGGDELFGLMRAFLAAGAASLVATLWTVEDHSTARLMKNFYSLLSCGYTKGKALRQAQLHFLQQPDLPAHYRHPYFWAPFFLVGHSGTL